MALNSSGHPCIAYKPMRSSDGAKEIRYAEKTDTGWVVTRVDTAAAPYTGAKNWSKRPAISIDSNDNPHIVYYNHPTESSDDPCHLKYAWRNDGKWYFDIIDTLATEEYSGLFTYPGLAIDKKGYSHISYGGEIGGSASGKMKYAKGRADTFGVSISPYKLKWLFSIYPSLVSREIKIVYSLSEKSNVDISVYDIAGRKVKELFGGEILAGKYEKWYEVDNLSSGIYFCILKSDKMKLVKKFILIE